MKINAAFNKIQNSEPISLYSASIPHPDTGMEILIISKKGKHNTNSKDMFLVVDNPITDRYDSIWDMDMFKDALESYYYLKSSGRLVVDEGIQEFNLDNAIEVVKQRGNGQAEYNIDTMQNGHIAMLATCYIFYNQIAFNASLDTFDELDNMYQTI